VKIGAYRRIEGRLRGHPHKGGRSGGGREEEQKRFVQSAEHTTNLEGLATGHEARRAEIVNRLESKAATSIRNRRRDANRRTPQSEYAEDCASNASVSLSRRAASRAVQTDLEAPAQGIEALKLVQQTKLEHRQKTKSRISQWSRTPKFAAERVCKPSSHAFWRAR